MLSFQSLIWFWAIVKSNSVSRTILWCFYSWCFTWVHFHALRSDQYFCLVPATYESIFLEHLNKLVVEPIDDILIFSMFKEIHTGHLALMLETFENHLCVITKYVFWMLEVNISLWFTCNCWKMSPWKSRRIFFVSSGIISNWSCMCGFILEMVACYFHFNKKFLYAQQATDWFIQEREKVQDLHYLLSCSPIKDSVVFHFKKLLVFQLSFGNHSLN
jgi:hypothetical protein